MKPVGGARLRAVLAVAGLALMATLCWMWRREIARVLTSVAPAWMGLAIVAGLALAIAQGTCFAELMIRNGAATSRRALVSAFLVSQPGKYVPGKVASLLLQQLSLGATARPSVTLSANVELAAILAIQATGTGAALALVAHPVIAACCAVGTVLGTAAVLRIPFASFVVTRVLRRGTVRQESGTERTSTPRVIALATASTVLVLGASVLVIRASSAWHPETLAPTLASLFLGVASSMVAFVVPAGLGVREAATAGIGGLLPGAPSTSQLVAISLLFRCWQLAVDATALIAGVLLSRSRH